jgi:RNA ligase
MDYLSKDREKLLTAIKNNEPYTVQEKMDGSLGIIYYYDGKWNVATKGSFTSDQAIKATEMLKKYNLSSVPTNLTLLVEIIYPANKIVVKYDEENLVLLTVVDNSSGYEFYNTKNTTIPTIEQFTTPKTFNYTIPEMIALQKTIPKDEEGFVVRFENGLRVKIKGEEYLRIHKMIAHMSPISFWEVMVNGKVPTTYLEQLPDEFRDEFRPIIEQLEKQYKDVLDETVQEFLSIPDKTSRKTIGLYLKDNPGKHARAMFSLLDSHNEALEWCIMKQIYPKANQLKGE